MALINTALSLAGLGVLVTRPKPQAEELCAAIEAQGGRALCCPVIEIADPVNLAILNTLVACLDDFDIAIFISPNAVVKAVALLQMQGRELPANLRIAAIGKATATALVAHGIKVDIFPSEQFNSEALLSQEAMLRVQHKRILIFRGVGGRELLAETLRRRGATVSYAEVYRRIKPNVDIVALLDKWSGIDVVIVTSNEGLRNLYEMMDSAGRSRLLATQLVVVSHRAADLAKKMGFIKTPRVAMAVSNEAVIEVLRQSSSKLGGQP